MNLHKMTLNPKITNTPSFPNYRADEFFANTKKSEEGDAIKKKQLHAFLANEKYRKGSD